ncbi:MAG: AI-2E family transporter [Myxococcota bacterium]|nr:AI-2E family transporter [Myxococcota bacterium]
MSAPRSRAQIAIAIILGVFLGVTLLGPILEILLLIFAGLIVAAFLHGTSRWINDKTRLPRNLALAIVCVILVGATVGWSFVVAPSISTQFGELRQTIPVAMDRIAERVGQQGWGAQVVEMFEGADEVFTSGRIVSGAKSAFSLIAGGIGAGLLVLFVGLFVAIDPGVYRRGLLSLVPVAHRPRAAEVLADAASTLTHWLVGQLLAMTVVGVLTWVGLSLLHVPLALTLAVVAAFLTFIPNLGPILAAVPALLLGFMVGPTTAMLVGVLYIAIQLAETYGITPFVQRRMLSLPPAFIICGQAVFGVVGGLLGLLVATPLLAVIVVFVRKLYVEDVVEQPRAIIHASD